MKVEQVLHMKGGVGKTNYATNSLLPSNDFNGETQVDARIEELLCTLSLECLKTADLGCASGPNTLLVVSDIIDNIHATFQKLNSPPPSLQAFLNDLPGNDFNTVFRSLPGFYKKLKEEGKLGPCFITATPGSFYGRLFPNNSLHFVHSSYALIWISEAPKGWITEAGEGLNKKNICIAKTSSSSVCGILGAIQKGLQSLFEVTCRRASPRRKYGSHNHGQHKEP